MADNPSIRGPSDRLRINVDQEYEVGYWSQKLGVTSEQLRDAVRSVGTMVDAVEQHLRSKGHGHWREKSVG
jgi:hypothetical protein